jgi:hypothetical protein
MILLQTDSSWIADLGIGLIILGIILLLIWIWAIVDIARRPELSMLMKVIWVVIVIAFPFVGVILYLVFGRSTSPGRNNTTTDRRRY